MARSGEDYFRALMLTSTAIVSMAVATPAVAQTKNFNVQAQSASKGLATLARQADVQILISARDARGKRTKAVKGSMTVEQALQQLLRDTGLRAEATGAQTYTVVPFTGQATPSTALTASPKGRGAGVKAGNGQTAGSSSSSGEEGTNSNGEFQIGEIVVTAQKRAERLSDVPIPVTALRSETLLANNSLRLQDYYTRVPGLSLTVVGNNGAPLVAIRGITTGGEANPAVGIVVDDVAYGSTIALGNFPSPPDIDPGELERIEVLRGPQGALYGASSIGGLIKFVTADPSTSAFSGRVQGGFESVRHGEDLGYSVRGSVNVPVSDTLALRASAYYVREPGYIDNVLSGQSDVNRREGKGVRAAALWRPSDDFSIKLSGLIQQSNRDGTANVDTSLPGSPAQSLLPGTGNYDRRVEAYSATINARVAGIDLVSITGYNFDGLKDSLDITALYAPFSQAYFGVSGTSTDWNTPTKKFSQELRASIPLGESLTWMIGGYFTDEDILVSSSVYSRDDTSGEIVGRLYTNDQLGKHKEFAAFSNLTVELTDRFDVQLGGRLSWIRQQYRAVRTGIFADLFLGGDPSLVPLNTAKDSPFTYLITPRFKLSPDTMIYARVASGYRPGGPNTTCGFVGVPCRFQADTTRNYEVGLKGAVLDRRLSFDLSLYYIDWNDVQITLTDPISGFPFTDNAGKARSKGIELSVEARPTSALTLSGWVALNDAELAQDLPSSATFFGQRGDRLPFSSRFSGAFSAHYNQPLSEAVSLTFGGTLAYVGKRIGQFQPTAARAAYPAYAQLDLNVGVTFDQWQLNAFLNNVTDKRGVLRIFPDVYLPNLATLTEPRSFGLTLARTF